MQALYSHEDIRKTYEEVVWHRRCRDIIREYALNTLDIRDAALEGIDLADVHDVLDLGCGYGFFMEGLPGRLKEGAKATGIDVINKSNAESFMDTVSRMGCTGTFIQGGADLIMEMPDALFDLIIASYSLYFFPHLVPEIARILRSDGLFIAVTHSRSSLQEVIRFVPACMRTSGVEPPDDLKINKLFGAFSLEDGTSLLAPYFRKVECILYDNSLVFPIDRFDDCVEYLDTKKHLLFKDVSEANPLKVEEVEAVFNRTLFEHARIHGKVLITKDDGIFRCSLPVHEREVI